MRSAFGVFVLAALLILGSLASAQQSLSVQQLVERYYAQKETGEKVFKKLLNHRHPTPDHCDPDPQACSEAACKKLGTFGCDELSEITEVNRACRGNYGDACLNAVCGKLGSFGCDEMKEIVVVARSCVGNHDASCFESVCRRLGTFGCDEMKEVEEVLRSCAGH